MNNLCFIFLGFLWTCPLIADDLTQPIRQFDVVRDDIDINSVAFSPDGRTLVSAGDVVRLLDVETGREIRQYQPNSALRMSQLMDSCVYLSVTG